MKALSEREQEVMNVIWEERNCSVDDVLQRLPESSRAYTTIQTFMRILEQKEFLAHKREGKLQHMKDNLFGGSAKSLLNTFISDNHLSESDINELMSILEELKGA